MFKSLSELSHQIKSKQHDDAVSKSPGVINFASSCDELANEVRIAFKFHC